MFRFVSTLFAAALFSITVSAQDFPSWGTITADEVALKECAFDKEAPAVVLIDEAIANHDDEYNLITIRHIKIKILKQSGFDFANIEIPYVRKDKQQYVEKVEAMVTNIEDNGVATVTQVEKKSIYDNNVDAFTGKVIFTFPNIKVGSIIEYKYKIFSEHYGYLDEWAFHNYLPVVKSCFKLYVPPRLEFTYQVQKAHDYPIVIKPVPEEASMYFEMNNMPGIDNEPFMDARKDYIQKVIFQISGYNNRSTGYQKTNTTWEEVIREFQSASDFGSQLRKSLAGTGDFMDKVKTYPTGEAKLKAVLEFVRMNMKWNGYNSRFSVEGIKDAWNKRTGTNGDINLILVNLLRETGLEAYPVLVSERSHGKVRTDYPFIDQFNTVFAKVVINDVNYYLDATDKYTPYNMIPKDILNTTALVVDRKKGGLVNISNDSLIYDEYIHTVMQMDTAGKVTGDAIIKSDGYAKAEKIALIKTNGDNDFVNNVLKNDDFSAITAFKFLNKEADSLRAEQQFKFEKQLTASGGYYFIPLNSFSGLAKNPFTSSKRFSNINFGFGRKINLYTSVQLPAGFVPEMPRPIRITTPDHDISFGRSTEYDKETNTVVCMILIEFKKSLYNYDEYSLLQQLYKKMFEYLKEPLALKKKP
ncbi:MAG: DUF3857 domain-containing protein [Ferruginibacter sp.]